MLLLTVAACRRDVSRLDDVQKMAYSVKPAVVRVTALATADFRYDAGVIRAAEAQLHSVPRGVPTETAAVETGAGGSGSGFIIHPDGFILTSGHVVAPTRDAKALERELRRNGAIATLVKHFPKDDLRALQRSEELDATIALLARMGAIANIKIVNDVELSNGETLPFTIRRYSPSLGERGVDLAVLHVGRKNLPSLVLGNSESVRVGESIWAVGYPAVASSSDEVIGGWLSRDSDFEATLNPGTITAIKRNIANAPVFQSNVAIYRGNSGGPAVNLEGEAVGVSTWGHTSAEQIKFLVPIAIARQMLAEAKVPAGSDGEFNRYYHAALDDAYDGQWLEAKKNLHHAAGIFPRSPDVIRFMHDVDEAIRALPPWQLHPVVSGAAVAFIAAILATSAFLVVRSRRPQFVPDVHKATTVETLIAPTGAASARAILGKFTILNGQRAGERLGLGGSGIRIGRESTICEIVLENPKISRLHAEVVSIDGKVLLIDRNSSNGTYVNDQKIDKTYLKDGDIIYFGGRNAVAVAFHA
ncbi:MAG TPA: trypsin-like peptidase domain-containing protein [Thermoanaerobaculia bacterium]